MIDAPTSCRFCGQTLDLTTRHYLTRDQRGAAATHRFAVCPSRACWIESDKVIVAGMEEYYRQRSVAETLAETLSGLLPDDLVARGWHVIEQDVGTPAVGRLTTLPDGTLGVGPDLDPVIRVARPDGFAQSDVDAAKASLLASTRTAK